MIQGWYCKEKLDANHSGGKGLREYNKNWMKYIQNYNVKTNLKVNVHITHNTHNLKVIF